MRWRTYNVKKEEVDAAIKKPSLAEDYRDPQPIDINKIKQDRAKRKKPVKIEVCKPPSLLSLQNVRSRTKLYDLMDSLLINDEPRVIFDDAVVREKSRLINILTTPLTDRKQRRVLTPKEEWLLLELEEDGFTDALKIINELIVIDKEMRAAQKYFFDAATLSRQPLGKDANELEFLIKILKFWELHRRNGDTESEFSLMLYVAMHYEAMDDSWLWIVYEFYLLALEAVDQYRNWDFGFCEATVRYLFGRVLLERMNELDEAYEQLVNTHALSLGKTWTTTCVTEIENDNIHRNAAFLIYIIQLLRAEKYAYSDPAFSIDCLRDGARKMIDSGTSLEMGEALLELAMMYNRAHQPDKAEAILLNLIYHFSLKGIEDWENLCNCHLYLAFCYRRMGLGKKAFDNLNSVLTIAEKHQLNLKKAEALKHLGEYYITKKMFHTARKFLRESKLLFAQLKYTEEVEETAILHGYAKATIHFSDYCDCLINGQTPKKDDFYKICYWGEYAIPFWRHKGKQENLNLGFQSSGESAGEEEEEQEDLGVEEQSSGSSDEYDAPNTVQQQTSSMTISRISLDDIYSESVREESAAPTHSLHSVEKKGDVFEDKPINLAEVDELVTDKDEGLQVYLQVMKQLIHFPGHNEEMIDLGLTLNCYLKDEQRFKILEKIDEVKFVAAVLDGPPITYPTISPRQERQAKICIFGSSSEDEDEIGTGKEGCKEDCADLNPIVEMPDAKLPNKIYLIDFINQVRTICNENFLLSRLPEKKGVFIPYSPGVIRLIRTYHSEDDDTIFVVSPYKNLLSRLLKDLHILKDAFHPDALFNESVGKITRGRSGKIAKKDVLDVTPFKNILKAKLDSYKNKVIKKHQFLSGENKRQEEELTAKLMPKQHEKSEAHSKHF